MTARNGLLALAAALGMGIAPASADDRPPSPREGVTDD
jgi:hypothetical protein